RLTARGREDGRDGREEVYVARARQTQAVVVEIGCRQAQVLCDLTLEADAALLDVGLLVVGREEVEARVRGEARGRGREYVRVTNDGVDLVGGRERVVVN